MSGNVGDMETLDAKPAAADLPTGGVEEATDPDPVVAIGKGKEKSTLQKLEKRRGRGRRGGRGIQKVAVA